VRLPYVNFDDWKRDAKSDGLNVRKVSVSDFNTYYQAFNASGLRGFFNTWEGPKGKHSTHKAGGELTRATK
jgi:hypothetical protein